MEEMSEWILIEFCCSHFIQSYVIIEFRTRFCFRSISVFGGGKIGICKADEEVATIFFSIKETILDDGSLLIYFFGCDFCGLVACS